MKGIQNSYILRCILPYMLMSPTACVYTSLANGRLQLVTKSNQQGVTNQGRHGDWSNAKLALAPVPGGYLAPRRFKHTWRARYPPCTDEMPILHLTNHSSSLVTKESSICHTCVDACQVACQVLFHFVFNAQNSLHQIYLLINLHERFIT